LEDTIVCSVDIEVFKKLVQSNVDFSMDVLHKMSQLYDNIIETKFNLSKKHLRGRIAYILLLFSERIYKKDRFSMPISRKEIAELIDMTPENVIRILSEFNSHKVISLNGKEIEILEKEKLQMISEHG
jgi:CRP/FNR family transcriptional regulator